MMETKDAYSTLPKEVLSVSERIGLRPKSQKDIIDSYVSNVVPKNLVESELRFTTYLLDEKHNSFNDKRKQKKKCKNGLTAKQRRVLFKWSKSDVNYETFEKINVLWHKYMDALVQEVKSKADQIKLIKADFHGSFFIVSASNNPTLVGLKGFVVQETKNTFKMVTKENRLLTVPKEGSIFAFEHNQRIHKLNGYNIKMSSHQRSRVKPKMKLKEILVDF